MSALEWLPIVISALAMVFAVRAEVRMRRFERERVERRRVGLEAAQEARRLQDQLRASFDLVSTSDALDELGELDDGGSELADLSVGGSVLDASGLRGGVPGLGDDVPVIHDASLSVGPVEGATSPVGGAIDASTSSAVVPTVGDPTDTSAGDLSAASSSVGSPVEGAAVVASPTGADRGRSIGMSGGKAFADYREAGNRAVARGTRERRLAFAHELVRLVPPGEVEASAVDSLIDLTLRPLTDGRTA